MSPGPVALRAARLAAAAAWLDDADWRRDSVRLAGEQEAPRRARPPTVGDLARDGVALVEGLAAEARWDDAAAQATHLARHFAREGLALGPIAADTFDGLRAATLARDPEEVADFGALVREIFS